LVDGLFERLIPVSSWVIIFQQGSKMGYNSLVYSGLINQVSPGVYTAEEFSQIEAQVLLILGDKELIYNDLLSALQSARRLIPRVEAHVIPEAHHITALAQPQKVNQHLLHFFAS
jgi:pimeloyl-ACP methyl ester carboxylesterase